MNGPPSAVAGQIGTQVFDNFSSPSAYDPADNPCVNSGVTHWHSWSPPSTGSYTIECANAGSIYVYAMPGSFETATCVTSGGGSVSFSATAGVTYLIGTTGGGVRQSEITPSQGALDSVAAPTFPWTMYTSPASNGSLYLSCATSGAQIWYRAYGSSTWIPYTGSVSVGAWTRIEAMATKSGLRKSDNVTAYV